MRMRPLLLALLALAALPAGAAADSFTPTDPMATGRTQFAATLLANGQVLVAGGASDEQAPAESTTTSERYDPASGRWLGTPAFPDSRQAQGLSLLADGRALMTGGFHADFGGTFAMLDSALAYDPASNTWSGVASMPHAHGFQQQLTLKDGRVLVIGGYRTSSDKSSDKADDQIELYNPATGLWSSGAPMPVPLANGTATLLADGRVLVAGGSSGYTARNLGFTYDPATNGWTNAGSFTDARRFQTATLLPNGKVLIAGGTGSGVSGPLLRSASLFDPATNGWTDTAPMATARFNATATLLPNGKVLVAGGYDGAGGAFASAELYDVATNSWSPAAPMSTARAGHAATLLADGRVLVAGGWRTGDTTKPTPKAEVYTPNGWPFGGGGGGGGGGSGGGKPAISKLALSAVRFRAAASGPSATSARRRRRPVGTTITYRDAAAATATFTVLRPTAGRAANGRCVRATRANRRHRRCTRWVAIGRFRHADAAGVNSLHFSGRVGGDALLPGRFRLSVSARVGHGRASAAKAVGFRIVR
ncbi:MAG TPA: kelch repeat-containing protein [Conexibacter sp.]|nr:kelch repeat-containing protein [Conexibacter sp.]